MWPQIMLMIISLTFANTVDRISIESFNHKLNSNAEMVVWMYDELFFTSKEQKEIIDSLDKECQILKRQDTQCHILNVSKYQQTKEQYNIQNSKTFYFKNGLDLEYQLHYDFEYLIDFIEMRRKNSYYSEIKSVNKLQRLINDLDRETGMFGVLFIEKKEGLDTKQVIKNYQKVASYYMNQFEFYIVHDKEMMRTTGKQNRMVLYKGFDDKVVELDKLEFYYMDRFVYLYSKPSLVKFNDVFMEYLLIEVYKPVVMLFLGEDEETDSLNLK